MHSGIEILSFDLLGTHHFADTSKSKESDGKIVVQRTKYPNAGERTILPSDSMLGIVKIFS